MSLNTITLLLLASTSTAAFAQDTPVVTGQQAESPTVPGDRARDAEDVQRSSVASEIVVTARRRQEAAQDVPIPISVIGVKELDNTGSFNVQRLQQLQPTLQFYSSNPRNSAVNIRGLGAPLGLTNDGIEQGVGVYIDQVYFSRVAVATLDFLDVQQIETLRGPQGTLYGKNTVAGAISITSKAPSFDFEGRAEVSIGNLEFKQAKASVSGPLNEDVAVRLGISTTSRQGTVYNRTSGNFVNAQDNVGIRGAVLWNATDALSLTLSGDYNRQNPECCAQIFVRLGQNQRALNRQYDQLAAAQNYVVPSRNPFDRVTDVDAELNALNILGGVSLRGELDLGDGILTSVTAWRFWDWGPANDRDFTGLPITTLSQNPTKQDQFTQELRYAHKGDGYDFVLGAFGFYQKIRTTGVQEQGPAASRWLIAPSNALSNDPTVLNGLTANNDILLKNYSAAVFGKFNWDVTDRITLSPGIRVNYDKKDGSYDSVVRDGQGNLIPVTGGNARQQAQRGVLAPQSFAARYSQWNLSYDLTASYKPARDLLLYATYSKAFKTGGINLNGVPADAAGNPILSAATVRPEKVDHFELGLKSQFWDRKATFNVTAFWTEIRDYQAQVFNGQLGVLRGYLANAESVRVRGIEADFSIRPTSRLSGYINGAFTDAKYTRFVDAPCPPELSGGGTGTPIGAPGAPGTNSPANCDISGQWLPGVSRVSFSYGAEYNLPGNLFGESGEAYLAADANTRSKFSSNASRSIYTDIDGYTLANFRLGYRTDRGFNIFAWVKNAFETEYFDQLAVPSGNVGFIVGNVGDPRTYGLTISAAF